MIFPYKQDVNPNIYDIDPTDQGLASSPQPSPREGGMMPQVLSPFPLERVGVRMVCILCLLLVSCTRADIHYPDETPLGVVRIHPDNSTYDLPALTYHFYNIHTQTEYITRSDDGSGNFEGVLPAGTYRVIATNTGAENVAFSGMDHYETAVVTASAASPRPSLKARGYDAAGSSSLSFGEGRGEAYSLLEQPDNVYSTVIGELVVIRNDTIRKEPMPTLLTKQLNLVFSMQGGLDAEVTSMTGVLPGIYPAVFLYTFQGAQLGQSPTSAIHFETVAEGDERKAQISLFGVRNPERGEAYTNHLELNLTLTDGSTSTKTLDLTDVFSDVIEGNGGTIPLELSIPIAVMRRDTIKVEVEVGEWVEEGENEKEV